MKVLRSEAIDLAMAQGFKTAGKWNREKMDTRLAEIIDAAQEDFPDLPDEEASLLKKLIKAKKSGEAIEVVVQMDDDEDEPADAAAVAEAVEEKAEEDKAATEAAEEAEDDEEDKAPVKKAPVKKAPVKKAPVKKAPVKKGAKTAPAATTKKASVKTGPSNKEVVYRMFEKNNNVDPEKCLAKVNEAVKMITIRGWISTWKRGVNLPACAKNAEK